MTAPAPRRSHEHIPPTAGRQLVGISSALDSAALSLNVIGIRPRFMDFVRSPDFTSLVATPSPFARASADFAVQAATDQLRGLYQPPPIPTAALGMVERQTSVFGPTLDALREISRPRFTVPTLVPSPQLSATLKALDALHEIARMPRNTAPVLSPSKRRVQVPDNAHEQNVRQVAVMATTLTQDPAALAAAQDVLHRPDVQELIQDRRVRREARRLAASAWPITDGLVKRAEIGIAAIVLIVAAVYTAYGHGSGAMQFLAIATGVLGLGPAVRSVRPSAARAKSSATTSSSVTASP